MKYKVGIIISVIAFLLTLFYFMFLESRHKEVVEKKEEVVLIAQPKNHLKVKPLPKIEGFDSNEDVTSEQPSIECPTTETPTTEVPTTEKPVVKKSADTQKAVEKVVTQQVAKEYVPSKKPQTNKTAVINTAMKAQTHQVSATYYTAGCAGCSGITATGLDVRNSIAPKGERVIAVDPNVIPLGSKVRVSTPYGSFNAVAGDTGGAINGNSIDILVGSTSEAIQKGRVNATVTVLK